MTSSAASSCRSLVPRLTLEPVVPSGSEDAALPLLKHALVIKTASLFYQRGQSPPPELRSPDVSLASPVWQDLLREAVDSPVRICPRAVCHGS